jgi:hypothetical protein
MNSSKCLFLFIFLSFSLFSGTTSAQTETGVPPEEITETPQEEASPPTGKTPLEDAENKPQEEASPPILKEITKTPLEDAENKPQEEASPPTEKTNDPDSPDIRATFVRGNEALIKGRFGEAKEAFAQVAATSKFPLRQEAADALQKYAAHLERVILDNPELAIHLSDGRVEFIVTSTFIGAYAGVVLLDILDVNDVRLGVALVLATTGSALAGSLFGSRGAGIREADADAYTLGAFWGGSTALLSISLLDSYPTEVYQTAALLGVAGGAFGSFYLSRVTHATQGQVGFIGNTMTLGSLTSLLASPFLINTGLSFDGYIGIQLASLQVGTGLGIWLAQDLDWSAARSRLTLLGSGVGGLLGWGTAALITGAGGDIEGDTLVQVWSGAALAGLWTGYGLTIWLTEDMNPDTEFESPLDNITFMPLLDTDTQGLSIMGTF